ncbi:ABC transporter permease [Demequina sp. TTPB684]|uniref:ABC transporter permease n=1 Tax=unclassified Demequina TaxID=2620311 RepID=UPI001CF1B10F|nr:MULTISPECIES: ABC transporter permease [unclassified Demequina]MCB2411695.1 ABC transporter permease [Demequina sp. TTPB684]UPU87273.1 ABC transporter permease [Demequina sp. TMPB413]
MTAVSASVHTGTTTSLRSQLSKWKAVIGYAVIALVSLLAFGLGVDRGDHTSFSVSQSDDALQVPNFSVPSQPVTLTLAVILFALAGYQAWALLREKSVGVWMPIAVGLAFMGSLLTWAGAGRGNTNVALTGMLVSGVFLAVPLVFGAMAGTLCERSGVVNIAIEGQLLGGAFLAAVVASATNNAYIGMAAAPIAGAFVGALLALFAVRYWVDQIVVGVVLNVLVIGITSFLFSTVLSDNPDLNQAGAQIGAQGGVMMQSLPIPLLSEIPILGPVLFDQNALVYVMYAIVVVFQIMLFKSRWGLRVRAVGEHPKAADTVGIKVNRTRVRNTILGGAIAGLGGAFFTVASGLAFSKEMTSGKGYIALAAMILGRWNPKGALLAALLFGFADSLRIQLGVIGSAIPSEFLAMLPYLATIFAVAGLVGKSRPPAAENIPYKK